MTSYLVHVGYSLMLFALLARDILWLRSVLIFAQSSLAEYAYLNNLYSISFWNWLFVAINTIWVFRILQERRAVTLPAHLKPIYDRHFAALTPPEFLRIWSWGEHLTGCDELLVRQGEHPDALYFLTSGTAVVYQDGKEIATLRPGTLIAEMSLLTGEATTADVRAHGAIEYMKWPSDYLQNIRRANPVLWTKIQSVIGHDLVEKIKQASKQIA